MRRVPAAAVPVFAAVAGSVSVFAPGTNAAHIAYLIGFTTVVVCAWIGLRTIDGPSRGAYRLIAGALTVWLTGDILYDLLDRFAGPLGDVTVCDLLWLSGYPFVVIAMIKLVRLRAPGRLRDGLLDAAAMTTVVAWLFWQFLILPAAENQELSLATFVGASYTFGDVTLFAATAILVFAPGSIRGPARYLVGALTLTLIGDISISLLPVLFPDLSRSGQADRFDGLLLLANSLLAAGIVHRGAAKVAAPDHGRNQRLHPARVVFLGIALVVLPTVTGLHSFGTIVSRVSLLVSIAMLTSFILVRFVTVVREQERIKGALAHQAEHDQLTGLANRASLRAQLELELFRAAGFGPVVLYMDLNGFKQINDRYGHAAGDVILVEFARRLTTAIRPADTAARLGGDEFVVLATGVEDEERARALAHRLRALADEPVHWNGETLHFGVSVGLAAWEPLDRPNGDALLAVADAAMYAEKVARKQAA
ncbi:GGDEF domain-containing protein [Paractinoplanes globisporus]|uniref:Diguanylate cyclase domain-containing protein n=1 Tax=Paractinoplanes globisporus TaxID=113565 RepID=A0ABW6WXB2_9ACTN|nr:GGDEF domain-containing protein [Actinoplanes globisporus]